MKGKWCYFTSDFSVSVSVLYLDYVLTNCAENASWLCLCCGISAKFAEKTSMRFWVMKVNFMYMYFDALLLRIRWMN